MDRSSQGPRLEKHIVKVNDRPGAMLIVVKKGCLWAVVMFLCNWRSGPILPLNTVLKPPLAECLLKISHMQRHQTPFVCIGRWMLLLQSWLFTGCGITRFQFPGTHVTAVAFPLFPIWVSSARKLEQHRSCQFWSCGALAERQWDR